MNEGHGMERQIVLIVESEQPEGFSARKLIIESLKHNVITAYSSDEAIDLLNRVKIDVVLVHSGIHGESCEELMDAIRNRFPETTLVALSPGGNEICGRVTTLDSLRPEQLVNYFGGTV